MNKKTVIVTGGSQGIGAGVVNAFLGRGYNVVANSRNITKSGAFQASDQLALVDGNIAESETAGKIGEVAKSKFGSIDALVNNAGIFFPKHFIDYTIEDLRSLVSVNIEGFLFMTQVAIKQMLAQKAGGSIVDITSTMVDHPIAGINVSVAMITKGGLQAVTRSLAINRKSLTLLPICCKKFSEKKRTPVAWCMGSRVFRSACRSNWNSSSN